MASKPSVRFRKTVNVRTPDMEVISVNAQNYAVLVTDVPTVHVSPEQTGNALMDMCGNLIDILWVRQEDMRRKNTRNVQTQKSGWNLVRNSIETGQIFGNEQLVHDTFERLFGEDFMEVVPVKKHKQLDMLLLKWDRLQNEYEHADAKQQQQ
eukprot:TRINITY_DN18863_c0_g1_i1.p1 TRINITY_DN18863_c0_g1~~TRINITY_DN18863_c0_g1_i1.p1  ORF type:complete len:174 (+),score=17.20 TRINITY_DN18863_c0_g1_i1:68-523(+)